jgi:hypothetical protein
MSNREFTQSPIEQGTEEEIAYTLDTTPWGASPSVVVPKVFDVTYGAREDVTATMMPAGSASVVGNVITLPKLKSLVAGHTYRLEVKFTSGGNIFEAWGVVRAED